MNCPRIPILGSCIVGAIAGAGIYLCATRRQRTNFESFLFLEAMTQGFLLAGALHLMFCIGCPEQLVEITDKKSGEPIHLPNATYKIETLHAVEIFVASVMLVVTGIRAPKSIWDKPGHSESYGHR